MTYQRFSTLPRNEALKILGERIQNNLSVTNQAINLCHTRGWTYRLSSSLFPLITYDKANIEMDDLPNIHQIQRTLDVIEKTIQDTKVRISCHPSEFNVLASKNKEAVEKTIDELNFYSSFMDRIGCSADYYSPMNLHIHNKQDTPKIVVSRFIEAFQRLDENCRKRLVIENDDKVTGWSVKELVEDFHPKTHIPVTFDYLHHKLHPNILTEEEAFNLCYETWGNFKPLFHYSESREGNNPRAHADYAQNKFTVYKDCDVDFELKMKDKAIQNYQDKYESQTVSA
jgi:UV DNA damage endonuclease